MATITVKNIPKPLYARLKQSAKLHRRSLNSEVIYRLEITVEGPRPDPEEFLTRARAIRESTPNLYLTEEDLREARNFGRL